MKRRNVLKILGCVPFVGWFKPKQHEIFGKPIIEWDGVPLDVTEQPQIKFGKYDSEYWRKNIPGIKKWSTEFTVPVAVHNPSKSIGTMDDVRIDADGLISVSCTLNENGVKFFEEILKEKDARTKGV
jgi:hypothetical protein